jgi:hypothetical protein
MEADFGFVHQILSYVRVHEESQTATVAERYNTSILEFLDMLIRFGPRIFSKEEYENMYRYHLRKYYRFLGKNLLLRRKREFWKYHLDGLKKIGYPLDYMKLLGGFLREVGLILLNPQNSYKRFKVRRRKLHGET